MTRTLLTISALCLCAACGGEAPESTRDAAAAEAPPADESLEDEAIAPAIVRPEEVADPSQPPSYEVAVASAAADHNNSKKRCESQPEAVRAQCEQEANAAFSEAREDLDRLRGNTP
jgi:hypothetical protein